MAKNKHIQYFLLSLLSIVLLTLAWQPFKILPLCFIGFIPLLILEKKIRAEQANSKAWLFMYVWFAFLGWNIGTVWWIWNSSEGGAIAAFIINSLPMVLPFMFYHIKNRSNHKENFWLLVSLWIGVEWMQFHWDLAFPWLVLGNVFSYLPISVQWYEFTGVIGGSLWVLAFNIQGYKLSQNWSLNTKQGNYNGVFHLVFFYLLAPLFLSFYLHFNHPNQLNNSRNTFADIIVVQPNIDPYSEKFGGMAAEEQLRKMLVLAESKMDSQVQFIMLPETALQGGLRENEIETEPLVQLLKSFLMAHPNVSILSGMDSYKVYPVNVKGSLTARQIKSEPYYFDAFNAALFLNNFDSLQIYHKCKLVPGVEKMPYPQIFGFIEKYSISLGGTSGSLGNDGVSKVFNNYHKIGLAPIICYESVFPEFIASYVNQGAKVLCIITNDGWWGNTPGYQQHFDFARLRAIETRRFVARSANTGISGFIDDEGNVIGRTDFWKEDVMRMKVPALSQITFYTEHGDWLAYLFLFVAGFELMSLLVPKNR